MTVQEAATVLEVRPATVYALCRAGLIGHMRIGVGRGTIRIEADDIERFKAEARAKGADPTPSARPTEPGANLPLSGMAIPLPSAETYIPRFVRRPGGGRARG